MESPRLAPATHHSSPQCGIQWTIDRYRTGMVGRRYPSPNYLQYTLFRGHRGSPWFSNWGRCSIKQPIQSTPSIGWFVAVMIYSWLDTRVPRCTTDLLTWLLRKWLLSGAEIRGPKNTKHLPCITVGLRVADESSAGNMDGWTASFPQRFHVQFHHIVGAKNSANVYSTDCFFCLPQNLSTVWIYEMPPNVVENSTDDFQRP